MKYSDYINFDNYLPNINFNQIIDETTEEGIQNYYSLLKNEYLQALLKKMIRKRHFKKIETIIIVIITVKLFVKSQIFVIKTAFIALIKKSTKTKNGFIKRTHFKIT